MRRNLKLKNFVRAHRALKLKNRMDKQSYPTDPLTTFEVKNPPMVLKYTKKRYITDNENVVSLINYPCDGHL